MEGEDPFKCLICFEIAHDPAPPPCGHMFCLSCIRRSISHTKHRCPVCKKPFGGWARKKQKVSQELKAKVKAMSEQLETAQEQAEHEQESLRVQARVLVFVFVK